MEEKRPSEKAGDVPQKTEQTPLSQLRWKDRAEAAKGGLLGFFIGLAVIVPGISGLVMCVIFLFIGLRYKSRLERQGRHMVHQTPVTIRYSFHENGYTTGKGKEAAHTPYRLLRTLCCGGNYDVLMLDRRRVFVIDHSRFLQGDPEQFRKFLEERTGLTFQRADA